ncbi:Gryzun, putative trafficking through golgi-domain-containing protein [Aspergillus bertholletiae]|uniref:Gryzun, putative trafficking through golgi-domain-containing protein n=1 Tax=Aspergillus bertholletiae TaxID=1226010 RepID=A0A5N7BCC8_9EURO|nr:Gryzun, putative trafficking through golgi-domain-containing protein [Aspergillus bertholletiae]
MDAYPEDYVVHNLPFILLSGLEPASEDGPKSNRIDYPLLHERGVHIYSDLPPLSGSTAEELREILLAEDASRAPWEARENTSVKSAGIEYKIKSVGRSYRLPPRKADPPPVSPPMSPTGQDNDISHAPYFVLHSPISPLTPGSPTFSDGLLTPLWVTKHQNLVPAAVINFFPFCLDPNMSSLRDNQLKIEINELKKDWSSSGYKTRFIVVLLSEESNGAFTGDVDDRVTGIRRTTNMDQKSIFLLPPDATPDELKAFGKSLLALLQPSLMEYYRDLSKHARRKRNRSSIPPPTAPPTTGTSQTLSLQGWNVRYEFKMGIFAEFRQEIDAALRNYECAYETLFGQEVFENIAGWSPRFNDARLLADTIAMRIIRCLLWTGQTAAAVRSWVEHRSRSQDIINRRGKGTRNYGWEAWEARWSMVMAQLIRQAEIPYFTSVGITQDQFNDQYSIFIPREKTVPPGDVSYPWEQLHHEGYWLYRSAKHTMHRRNLADQIPDEDRIPPGQSPASQIASKSYLYDTYLAPETHVEAPQSGVAGFSHSDLILTTLNAALDEFSKRDQVRKAESLRLEIAEEYMRVGSWTEAYDMLQPLWSKITWRHSGWWQLMEKFGWALRECAVRVQDSETILRVDWELLNRAFQPKSDWCYDIHRSLEDITPVTPKPSVVLRAEDVISSVTASFIFEKPEGNVGEPLRGQLVISSCAQRSSSPIKLSEIKIAFEGCLRPIKLQSSHAAETDATVLCTISSPSLREPSTSSDTMSLQSPTTFLTPLIGTADLTIGPSQTKVFDVACIPREAGESRVASITLLIEEEKFDLTCAMTDLTQCESFWWKQTNNGVARRRVGKNRDTGRCKIKPKPPKIRITTANLMDTYYTNERIVLRVGMYNEEDEAAEVAAEARLFGRPEATAKVFWLDEESSSGIQDSERSTPVEGISHFIKRPLGIMETSSQRELEIVLSDTHDASDYELEISSVYNLVSDIQTPIIATLRVKIPIIRPFEANYEFMPRLHPQPWPNFFTVNDALLGNDSATKIGGLQQRWCLNSRVVSFAPTPLVIEKISLVLVGVGGGATCHIGPEAIVGPGGAEIYLEELRESNFVVDVHKGILGDRRPTSLNLTLEIQWRRSAADESELVPCSNGTTISTLAVPRFVVPGGEPRVLASAMASRLCSGLIHLDYTIENPSMHFLTFNLTMEASEDFAFSGPKTLVVQLVPLSRHTVRYNLLASKRGLWIQPQLVVVDTYFNKTLRVLPTEDMRSDKKGPLVWVDADD